MSRNQRNGALRVRDSWGELKRLEDQPAADCSPGSQKTKSLPSVSTPQMEKLSTFGTSCPLPCTPNTKTLFPRRLASRGTSTPQPMPSGFLKRIQKPISFSLVSSPLFSAPSCQIQELNAATSDKVHGNAGHIAQNTRASQYRLLSGASPHTHIIALDYRGYGHSTGTPTEQGLITDAATLVDFALDALQIPPSRIVLLGQSLGTAVASATAEKFSREKGIDFAGVVLVASFSSLPTMLANYSLGGVVPLLKPLGVVPPLLRAVLRFIVDKWPTIDRLAALVAQVCKRPGGRLRLHLIHAADDWDIPCVESVKIFDATAKASVNAGLGSVDEAAFAEIKDSRTVVKGKKAFKTTWKGEADVLITHEQFAYGGEWSIFETLTLIRHSASDLYGILMLAFL